MALNNAIRRAASRVVPLAIRASGGSQRYLRRHHGAAVLTVVSLSSRNLRHRCSTKAKSDESLLKALTSQLQCAAEAEEKVDIPAGFPFKIEDNPGKQIVTLTREFDGENITVEVRPPVIDEDSDSSSSSDSGDEEGIGDLSSIPLVLRVTKKAERA